MDVAVPTASPTTSSPTASRPAKGARANDPRFRSQFRKTEMCAFFASGWCSKSERCEFAHGPAELQHAPDLTKTSLCLKWLKWSCKRPSEQCPFAHGAHELRCTNAYSRTDEEEPPVPVPIAPAAARRPRPRKVKEEQAVPATPCKVDPPCLPERLDIESPLYVHLMETGSAAGVGLGGRAQSCEWHVAVISAMADLDAAANGRTMQPPLKGEAPVWVQMSQMSLAPKPRRVDEKMEASSTLVEVLRQLVEELQGR